MLLKAYIVSILVSVQLVLKIKDKKSPFLWNLLPRNQDFKLPLCPNKTSQLTLSLYTIVNTLVNTFYLQFCHRILTSLCFRTSLYCRFCFLPGKMLYRLQTIYLSY